MKILLALLFLLTLTLTFKTQGHPEANLQIMDYCRHFKYPIEAHKVIT